MLSVTYLYNKPACVALSLRLTGDLGVVVHEVFFPLLGSHVVAEREQQVLLVETLLLLLGFAEAGKTQAAIFH